MEAWVTRQLMDTAIVAHSGTVRDLHQRCHRRTKAADEREKLVIYEGESRILRLADVHDGIAGRCR